jgi:hypothetical protein
LEDEKGVRRGSQLRPGPRLGFFGILGSFLIALVAVLAFLLHEFDWLQ